jgi:uncharacterized coiled-coil DUF342 family protein
MGCAPSQMDVQDQLQERKNDFMELIKFTELESKLKNLLDEHASLKRRNLELETDLKYKIAELEEANNKQRGFKEERDSVRTKVDSLLELLQDIGVPK